MLDGLQKTRLAKIAWDAIQRYEHEAENFDDARKEFLDDSRAEYTSDDGDFEKYMAECAELFEVEWNEWEAEEVA